MQSPMDAVSTATNRSIATSKIAMPIAILMWINGLALLLGLPQYFRQDPPRIPSFYRSITCRKTILVSFPPPPPFSALSKCMQRSLVSFQTDRTLLLSVVLIHWSDPRLFPDPTLQPQLEISLVQPPRPSMDHRSPHHRILHRSLDRLPHPVQQTLYPPPLDRTHLRHRPRRSPLGPNPLEHFQHGLLDSLGPHALK